MFDALLFWRAIRLTSCWHAATSSAQTTPGASQEDRCVEMRLNRYDVLQTHLCDVTDVDKKHFWFSGNMVRAPLLHILRILSCARAHTHTLFCRAEPHNQYVRRRVFMWEGRWFNQPFTGAKTAELHLEPVAADTMDEERLPRKGQGTFHTRVCVNLSFTRLN